MGSSTSSKEAGVIRLWGAGQQVKILTGAHILKELRATLIGQQLWIDGS